MSPTVERRVHTHWEWWMVPKAYPVNESKSPITDATAMTGVTIASLAISRVLLPFCEGLSAVGTRVESWGVKRRETS